MQTYIQLVEGRKCISRDTSFPNTTDSLWRVGLTHLYERERECSCAFFPHYGAGESAPHKRDTTNSLVILTAWCCGQPFLDNAFNLVSVLNTDVIVEI